jgi:hypothetical protein
MRCKPDYSPGPIGYHQKMQVNRQNNKGITHLEQYPYYVNMASLSLLKTPSVETERLNDCLPYKILIEQQQQQQNQQRQQQNQQQQQQNQPQLQSLQL